MFIRNDAVPGLPERCTVVQVGPLLRELISGGSAVACAL